MEIKNLHRRDLRLFSISTIAGLILILFYTSDTVAQTSESEFGEMAICKIQVKDKKYQLKPNQTGDFQRITNIPPLANVPIEITYPTGTSGEKVVLAVEDGGQLDNGEDVKVEKLNNKKKFAFTFRVTDHPGIHRITVQKGTDIKVVQLWVGTGPSSAKK